MADGVLAENQVMMVAANDHAGPALSGSTVVQNAVPLEEVAVRAHRFALVAEKHTRTAVAGDDIVAESVIRVLVTDGYAGPFVTSNLVVLEQAVLDAPADVQSIPAVVQRDCGAAPGAANRCRGVDPVRCLPRTDSPPPLPALTPGS